MRYLDKLAVAAMPTTIGIAVATLLFLAKLKGAIGPRMALSAIFALQMSVVLVGFATRARRLGGTGGGIAAIGFAAWVAPLVFGAGAALAVPLSGGGDGLEALYVAAGISMVFVMGWAFLSPKVDARVAGRAAAFVAPGVLVAGGALVALALVRHAVHPDPDRWVESQPTLRRIEIGDDGEVAGLPFAYKREDRVEYPPPSAYTMTRQEPRRYVLCTLTSGKTHLYAGETCGAIDVKRDALRGWWILREGPGRFQTRFLDRDLVDQTVHASDTAKGAAPPVGWTHGAGGGLVLAGYAFLVGRKKSREARDLQGVDGRHLGMGKVKLADGEIVVASEAAVLGECNVRVAPEPKVESYREAPGAKARLLGTGTVAEQRAEIEASAGSAALACVVTVVVTAAPLAVAAGYGFLGP